MFLSRIEMKGFNSQNITHELKQHTLFLGPRGAGKSSVWKAIQFALQSIPSANMQSKFAEHYDQASNTEKFSVTLFFDDGKACTRELSRNPKGNIQQKFLDGDKQLTRSQEIVFLQDLRIALPNVNNFLELSDQKKIARLFQIFPCDIDVEKVSDQIDRSKGQENELQRKILGKREAVQSLEGQLAISPIPSGATIAMLQENIAKTEKEIGDLKIQLREEEWSIQEKQRVSIMEEDAKKREEAAVQETWQKAETIQQQAEALAQQREEEAVCKTKMEAEEEKRKAVEEATQQAQEEARLPFEQKRKEKKRKGVELKKREDQKEAPRLPSKKRCQKCLAELSESINLADKSLICYACGKEQMSFPGLIRLKMLRKKIEKGATNDKI